MPLPVHVLPVGRARPLVSTPLGGVRWRRQAERRKGRCGHGVCRTLLGVASETCQHPDVATSNLSIQSSFTTTLHASSMCPKLPDSKRCQFLVLCPPHPRRPLLSHYPASWGQARVSSSAHSIPLFSLYFYSGQVLIVQISNRL